MQAHSKLLSGLALVAWALSFAAPASASQQFPAAIQAAAGMPCTPSCVLCHGVDPGTATTFSNKALGRAMLANGAAPQNAASLTAAYNKFAMDPANGAAVTALKAGIDPETNANLCEGGVTYGCGARMAKSAPTDDWSGLWFAAGAMLFGAILRRAKTRASRN